LCLAQRGEGIFIFQPVSAGICFVQPELKGSVIYLDSIHSNNEFKRRKQSMEFFTEAINVLKVLVIALGAGLAVWGVINLLEGYGNDNPGAKSQGMKQLMAGGGVVLIGIKLIPMLSGLFS
jgi:hypothetical protein